MASSSKPKNKFRHSWYKRKPPEVNPKLAASASNINCSPKHGYTGFTLYFPDDENLDVDMVVKYTSTFERFIEQNSANFTLASIKLENNFILDYKHLTENEDLKLFKDEIVVNTDFCLKCFGLAMHQTILNDKKCHEDDVRPNKNNLGIVRAHLINYGPIQQLKDLRVNYFGKLVSARGTVIKAGNIKTLAKFMAFSCAKCTGVQVVKQVEGAFTPPCKCSTKGCAAQSNFLALHASPFTRTINWQTLKIQELIGIDEYENGRVPRTLDCELTEDLVNCCVPGDDITIAGVIRVRSGSDNPHKNKQDTIFNLYLEAVSVINNKNHSQGSYGASERITFNIRDYYAIQKIHAEPQLFRLLVQSLCPNIYGHEVVKAGLLLALFGGTKSERVRAESHVLVVGDPGLGKSQMLQACTNVAPRGVYVCGNTSTSSGLTVTLAREAGGEFFLEAGALMLADQGCCCIDEFDKMPTQHACLLEAMEQQTISVAKAGIVCTLPTRATILAAANPAGGHYNKAKTIAENLKISSPMLSRFDLIFILLDQPNEEIDQMLSEHVLALHSGKNSSTFLNASLNASKTGGGDLLKDRLKIRTGEDVDHLPHTLFRKYIAYAQKYVNPKLSDEAKVTIKDFYLKLRKQFQTGDCTPVTTRQLNSLIRLTQARAKAELREEATEEDARDVIQIMQDSLLDIFTDDVGVMDTTRCHNGTGMSTKKQVIKLLKIMQTQSENDAKSVFTTSEIKQMSQDAGICQSKFFTVLQSLNIQGFILNKGANRYQLVTADL